MCLASKRRKPRSAYTPSVSAGKSQSSGFPPRLRATWASRSRYSSSTTVYNDVRKQSQSSLLVLFRDDTVLLLDRRSAGMAKRGEGAYDSLLFVSAAPPGFPRRASATRAACAEPQPRAEPGSTPSTWGM